VILDAFRAHRLERAVADVQRDLRALDASPGEIGQDGVAEMQAGRRRRHRPARAGVDRLVALAILRSIVAMDVRRQRDVANRIDRRGDVAAILRPQANRAPPVKVPLEHFAQQCDTLTLESDQRAGLQLLARMHERAPQAGTRPTELG
jgi:hypothetical protein